MAATAWLRAEETRVIPSASSLCLIGWAGCAITAGISDARTLSIPNVLSIGILGLFLIYAGFTLSPAAAATGLAIGAATLVVGFVAFVKGWLGGGDAKLLAACMAWAGLDNAFLMLAVTGIAGGAIALLLMSPYTMRAAVTLQRDWPPQPAGSNPMPYGVAIAAGALAVAMQIAG